MNEQLRVSVPFRAPKPLHPSTSHTMRVSLDGVADVYTLTVELWLVGVPRSMEPHSATAGTVTECIDQVVAHISEGSSDDARKELLRGPAVAELVAASLRRALLSSTGFDPSSTGSGERSALLQRELVRVLVVDANQPVRDLLQILLDSSGCDVVAVDDMHGALAACDGRDFDVAVIDVDLNGSQGAQLVRWLQGCRPPVRAIVVGTGVSHTNSDFAPATFLQKPFSRRELIEAIRAEPA